MPKTHRAKQFNTVRFGTAMIDRRDHSLEQFPAYRLPIDVKDSSNSAHELSPFAAGGTVTFLEMFRQ